MGEHCSLEQTQNEEQTVLGKDGNEKSARVPKILLVSFLVHAYVY